MANATTSPKDTSSTSVLRRYELAGQLGLMRDKQYLISDVLNDIQNGLGVSVEVDDTDGAIGILHGTVILKKSSAIALTLAAPTTGVDDGKILRFTTVTAQAHVVTFPSGKINGGALITATWTAAIGNGMEIIAYQGVWYTISTKGVTIA